MIKCVYVIANIFSVTSSLCFSQICKNTNIRQLVYCFIYLSIIHLKNDYFFFKDECYSYVVLKIDNVKSTTSVVKGDQPNWEQEFYL